MYQLHLHVSIESAFRLQPILMCFQLTSNISVISKYCRPWAFWSGSSLCAAISVPIFRIFMIISVCLVLCFHFLESYMLYQVMACYSNFYPTSVQDLKHHCWLLYYQEYLQVGSMFTPCTVRHVLRCTYTFSCKQLFVSLCWVVEGDGVWRGGRGRGCFLFTCSGKNLPWYAFSI